MKKSDIKSSYYINTKPKVLDIVVDDIYISILRTMNNPNLPIEISTKIKNILSDSKNKHKGAERKLLIYDKNDFDEKNPYEIASRKVCKDLNLNFLHYYSDEFFEKLENNEIDHNYFVLANVDINEFIYLRRLTKNIENSSLVDISSIAGGCCFVIENMLKNNNKELSNVVLSLVRRGKTGAKKINAFLSVSENSIPEKSPLGFNIGSAMYFEGFDILMVEKDPSLLITPKSILDKKINKASVNTSKKTMHVI